MSTDDMKNPALACNSAGLRGVGPQADYFTLSGAPTPGLATLTACNAAQSWDIRKAYANNWATVVPAGEELSKLTFRIEIWTKSQSTAWDAFAATYLARPSPAPSGAVAPRAMGFAHDQASAPPYNVSAVVVLDVRYLGQVEPGKIAHEIDLLEWRPPLPAPGKPNQSTPAASTTPPTASDKLGQDSLDAAAQSNDLNSQLTLLRAQQGGS